MSYTLLGIHDPHGLVRTMVCCGASQTNADNVSYASEASKLEERVLLTKLQDLGFANCEKDCYETDGVATWKLTHLGFASVARANAVHSPQSLLTFPPDKPLEDQDAWQLMCRLKTETWCWRRSPTKVVDQRALRPLEPSGKGSGKFWYSAATVQKDYLVALLKSDTLFEGVAKCIRHMEPPSYYRGLLQGNTDGLESQIVTQAEKTSQKQSRKTRRTMLLELDNGDVGKDADAVPVAFDPTDPFGEKTPKQASRGRKASLRLRRIRLGMIDKDRLTCPQKASQISLAVFEPIP